MLNKIINNLVVYKIILLIIIYNIKMIYSRHNNKINNIINKICIQVKILCNKFNRQTKILNVHDKYI